MGAGEGWGGDGEGKAGLEMSIEEEQCASRSPVPLESMRDRWRGGLDLVGHVTLCDLYPGGHGSHGGS